VLFMKNSGTLQNPGDAIVLPRKLRSDEVDYECELAVVIGKTCHNVSRTDALNHVLGYTCANDVFARDWRRNGVGFARKPPVFLKAGDSVTIEIEGIGRLTNPVVEEQGS
jgi:2-keto-4-pentenoate hydratase/2-oxohepta-3-ene-1,7-dioic acid hydratase in catechol pathway